MITIKLGSGSSLQNIEFNGDVNIEMEGNCRDIVITNCLFNGNAMFKVKGAVFGRITGCSFKGKENMLEAFGMKVLFEVEC